ncbi:MAG: ATP-dependent helicase [Planctomycetaceae bacterium]|nr:ATP-dependent helicase [Planctomycetaceae bacterium]
MSADRPDNDFEFLSTLNPQQRQAVIHGRDPLLIVAGAGTGKTTTLAHRVAWQLASGVPPERILLLTFSRRAAAEMQRRVEAILQNMDPTDLPDPRLVQRASVRRIRGGTFHAVATQLLRRHGQLIGLYPDFTIMDRGDSEDLMNMARGKLDLPAAPKGKKNAKKRFPLKNTCLDIYSRCVNTQLKLELVLIKWYPWCLPHKELLIELFTAYSELKEQQRVLDFDDLLLFWCALLQDPDGQAAVQDHFDCVLVDEYQDTNILQANILKLLSPTGQGVTAVGDDAQSIYSFRAATVRNILDFPDDFPGTTVVPLEQNYRSTQGILNVTNAVISEATERHHKQLWSDRGEGLSPVLATCGDEESQSEFLVDHVLENRESGVALRDQAILFRSSYQSMSLEAALTRHGIPFRKFGGMRFLEAAHIKDVLAFLKLAENPFDAISGFRVLQLLPGVGQVKANVLLSQLSEAGGRFDVWQQFQPPAATKDYWKDFVSLMLRLAEPPQETVEDTGASPRTGAELHQIIGFYQPLLEIAHDSVRNRLEDLQQLELMAGRYGNRQEFLSEMTLDPPSSSQDTRLSASTDDDCLTLSTIHSAKGLEWDSVFVIHATEGNIPAEQSTNSPEDIEEERRLFYVALTRARNRLFITRPERYFFQNRQRRGGSTFSRMTRFLPSAIQQQCERRTHGEVFGDLPEDGGEFRGDTSAVRKNINRLWS